MSNDQKWIADRSRRSGLTLKEVRVRTPRREEVTIRVRAVGLNPVDAVNLADGADEIGYEVSGTIENIGDDVRAHRVGDSVLSFRVHGGYATGLTVPERDVFTKPPRLGWAEAANLLLAGSAAAEMIYRTAVKPGDVVLVHGASGAVGISAVQQARLEGARVIGTASTRNWDLLRKFGAEPVPYGPGLLDRVRQLSARVDVALDAVGTDEAVDVSLELVSDRRRIASSAAFNRAGPEGFWIIGYETGSVAFRDQARQRLVDLAASGALIVPVVKTFPFSEAPEALDLVASGHAGGKVALIA